jgi:hypothetical protein
MLRQAIVRTIPRAAALRSTTTTAARAFFSSRAVSPRGGGGKGAGAGAGGRDSTSQAMAAARPQTAAGAGGLSRMWDNIFADPFFASDPFFRPFLSPRGGFGGAGAMAEVAPMGLDISETDTHFVVKAELPGVKKEEVKITLAAENVLTIEAERRAEESGEDKETKLHYR